MADEVETTGKTVEEAVKLALLELNATLDEVDIKIVDSGTPGHLLGLGAREAQVRVSRRDSPYVRDDDEGPQRPPPPREARRDPPAPPREARRDPPPPPRAAAEGFENERPPVESAEEAPESEIEVEDVAEVAHEFIQGLVDRMGFDAEVKRTGDDPISFDVVGDDSDELSALIGENGETLRAFGFLVNSMLGRMAKGSVRVIIDVDGYRRRREEVLREYALDIAEEVRDRNEPVTLEAMPAHERRMIHMALADAGDVRTYSIGEGRERRVVVGPVM